MQNAIYYYKKYTCLCGLLLFLQAFNCANKRPRLVPQPAPVPPPAPEFIKTKNSHPLTIKAYQKVSCNEYTQKKSLEPLPKKSYKKIYNFDFEDAIQKLREAADAKRGIRWTLTGDTLLRNAAQASATLYVAEDYVIQILNIFRAAKKICALYGKSGSLFEKLATKCMNQYTSLDYAEETEDFWINKVKSTNSVVVMKLQLILFPEEDSDAINQKLRLAENYVGFDDTHYNITTTFTLGEQQFALEDKKWLKLTEKQQSEFKNRKSKKWYLRLDPFEQKLIDTYLNKFLDGAHYIPTQIRYIPGCRNAYQKRILSYDQMGRTTVLGHYYHSGALASFVPDKDISEQIARNNWLQVSEHTNNISVISLNNNVNIPVFGEKHIVEQTQRIVGDNTFMYVPINAFGTFTTPMFKEQIHQLLQETSEVYRDIYPDLCAGLAKTNPLPLENNIFQAKIEEIADAKDKNYFNKIRALKEAAENSNVKNKRIHNFDQITGNYYADIGANYIACTTVLNQRKDKAGASILFSCKSGKDRTGFMSYLVDGEIIRMTHPALDADQGTKLYKALACASHQQFLSSLNGGMPGRFGMKPVRLNETARSVQAYKQLFPRTASSTVIPF
ncbi:tyrosine-protein phosphatase [Candidatus Cardinium hertigii]|jgi:hypothetical protein|uniref:Tyrosine specific protein phosphatases domain-containing protein n=1 Tax=Candidatus Cardinium hertigii TaxID=247481 RepID=A0A3N2QBZ8_9BACT|nr:tyrosine-protein phosphatase [Candidatus Cardinium hertigii]ROT47112.1 hypothetical protein EDM02_04485 [Candidatus Cardinium hertigii]